MSNEKQRQVSSAPAPISLSCAVRRYLSESFAATEINDEVLETKVLGLPAKMAQQHMDACRKIEEQRTAFDQQGTGLPLADCQKFADLLLLAHGLEAQSFLNLHQENLNETGVVEKDQQDLDKLRLIQSEIVKLLKVMEIRFQSILPEYTLAELEKLFYKHSTFNELLEEKGTGAVKRDQVSVENNVFDAQYGVDMHRIHGSVKINHTHIPANAFELDHWDSLNITDFCLRLFFLLFRDEQNVGDLPKAFVEKWPKLSALFSSSLSPELSQEFVDFNAQVREYFEQECSYRDDETGTDLD